MADRQASLSGWADEGDGQNGMRRAGGGYSVVVRDTLAAASPIPASSVQSKAHAASHAQTKNSTLYEVPKRLQYDRLKPSKQQPDQRQREPPAQQAQDASFALAKANSDQQPPTGPFKYKPGKYVRVSSESYYDDGLFASPPRLRAEPVMLLFCLHAQDL
jgi:hypothetical protein